MGAINGDRDPLEESRAPALLQRKTHRLGSQCLATEQTTCKGIARIFKGAEPEEGRGGNGRSCFHVKQQAVIPEAPSQATFKDSEF